VSKEKRNKGKTVVGTQIKKVTVFFRRTNGHEGNMKNKGGTDFNPTVGEMYGVKKKKGVM